MNNQEKGNILEDAVKQIETLILETKPGLADLPITIESKKIVVSEGVKHEIDLYVEIDHGHSYKSIFIFECKNWEDPVGKNEIIIFSEKIDVLNAQLGFFISNSFTKHAIAQSEKDNRLELVKSKLDHSLISEFPAFHSIEKLAPHVDVKLIRRGLLGKLDEGKVTHFDYSNCDVNLKGLKIDFMEYVTNTTNTIIDKKLNHEPTNSWSEGTYNIEYQDKEIFGEKELLINDLDIECLEYHISFPLKVIRPKIKYAFDIAGRGKVIQFINQLEDGNELTITFTKPNLLA